MGRPDQIQDEASGSENLIRLGPDDHALFHPLGAGCDQSFIPLYLNQTHSAGTGSFQAFEITEMWDLNTRLSGSLEYGRAFGNR
jgi:hypothetical protein